MKHVIAIALALFLFVSCRATPLAKPNPDAYTENPPPVGVITKTIPVWVDIDFSPGHREDIHKALAAWNKALNGYERFEVMSDEFQMETDVLRFIVFSGEGLLILEREDLDQVTEMLPPETLGWVERELNKEGRILNIVTQAVGTRNFQAIVCHELGHVLMLPHLPVENTLMYPSYSKASTCIDQITIKALASIRGWDWKHMQMCERPL